ncbi:MAG: hypothetical protein ACLRSP_19900 [Flavonifractor plautii]|nr:MAG TPA: hypothetical protein [Caudoviricetes sp.]
MLDEKDLQAIAEMMKGMESRIDQKLEKQKQEILDESTRRMKLLLDTEVTTRFNLLAEGQKVIMDAITPKNEIEQIRSEMDVLKLAVRTLSQDLAELKKAQ